MERIPASFRDPSGYVFRKEGQVYRAIGPAYAPDFEACEKSGLHEALIRDGLLIPHQPAAPDFPVPQGMWKVIHPRQIPYVSYASEWCFGELRDAALATLEIQRRAMMTGFSMKDATSSNIQFLDGKAMLIDSLSLETYKEGRPWVAYRQFCEKFLAPLALIAMRDGRLGRLTRVWPAGLPLDMVSRLLPKRSWLKPGVLLHIHLQARVKGAPARPGAGPKRFTESTGFSRRSFEGLISSLKKAVDSLSYTVPASTWKDYYEETISGGGYLEAKKRMVAEILARLKPAQVWDLGGNVGTFSRIGAEMGANTVCFDFDASCVELNYRRCREENQARVLPLVLDLMNPTPSHGWDGTERPAWFERGQPDLVMALALIHHLAISHNVPLDRLATFFARVAPRLLVEFVPKDDEKVQQLLFHREDIFPNYTLEGFREAMDVHFRCVESAVVPGTQRVMHVYIRR